MSSRGRVLWCLFVTSFSLAAQVNVTTYQYDLARTGANTNEFILNKSNVNANTFGLLYTLPVDGAIYGQPLYAANVDIPGKGTHNVVYVATENDSVYAFDADSGGALWQVTFTNSGAVTVSSGEVGCSQIQPTIGITSTPVIDLSRGAIYVVAMTQESGNYVQRLHALDLSTGAEKPGSPVAIEATYPGTGEGGSTVVFNPRNYKQRPGLMLLNGVVYTAWASHCDIGTYHGWLIGYDAGTLQQVSVYNNTPDGNMGSFWNGGAAPAADANGNIFVVSANGDFDGNQNLGESYIKLSSSGGLGVADYFTPFNYAALNGADLDTGSAGVALIGDEAGSPAHPHLMTSAGKEGRIYLIDRDNMGKLSSSGSDSQIPQSFVGGMPSLFGNPAYFNHSIYFCGSGSHMGAYSISNAQMSTAPVSQSYEKYGYPGCVPTISANGNSNGIVWSLEPFVGLHAYDANDLTRELYDSGTDAAPGSTVKYSVPTVANGKVYAGRNTALLIYGLLSAGSAGIPVSNSASGDVGSVAPGGLATIYGNGLAAGTDSAASLPAPLSLAGASVTVGGFSAPMLYASPEQVNFQVPFEVQPGNAVFTVFVNGSAVASGSLTVQAAAPGVFMMDGGRAAVVNQDGSVNSPGSPASAGSAVSVYATGLGTVSPQVASGAPAPVGSTASTNASVTVTIGTATAQLQFAGLAPGFAGLYQVNFVTPSLPAGQYALKISAGGAVSNVGTIAVQ